MACDLGHITLLILIIHTTKSEKQYFCVVVTAVVRSLHFFLSMRNVGDVEMNARIHDVHQRQGRYRGTLILCSKNSCMHNCLANKQQDSMGVQPNPKAKKPAVHIPELILESKNGIVTTPLFYHV